MAGANSTTPRFERPTKSRLEKMFQGLICRPQIAATLLGGLLATTGCSSERPDEISYSISTIAGERIVQIPHDVKVEGCNRMTLEGKEGCEFDRSKTYTLEQGHDVYKSKIESTCLFPDNYFCNKERVEMVFYKQKGPKENTGIQVKQHEGGGLSLDTLDFSQKCRNQVENIFFRTQAGDLIPVESNTAAERYELDLKGDPKGSYFRCEGVLWILNAAPKEAGEISYFEPVAR